MEVLPLMLQQVELYNQSKVVGIIPTINISELDHLMTSLNNFKMDDRNVDEPVSTIDHK